MRKYHTYFVDDKNRLHILVMRKRLLRKPKKLSDRIVATSTKCERCNCQAHLDWHLENINP